MNKIVINEKKLSEKADQDVLLQEFLLDFNKPDIVTY